MDSRTQNIISTLHPAIRRDVVAIIETASRQGIDLRAVSGFRSFEEQQKLYNQGRTSPGAIVTNAKPGSSWHNYGLAVDLVEFSSSGKPIWNNPNWGTIARIGKSYGFEWGGDWTSFKDKPHFQKRFGISLKEAYLAHNGGYIDLPGYTPEDEAPTAQAGFGGLGIVLIALYLIGRYFFKNR